MLWDFGSVRPKANFAEKVHNAPKISPRFVSKWPMIDASDSASFVVHLVGSDEASPYKHFDSRADAMAFAGSSLRKGDIERADIYQVANAYGPRVDIEAVKSGRAELIDTRRYHATPHEVTRLQHARWHRAAKYGPGELLKLLGLSRKGN